MPLAIMLPCQRPEGMGDAGDKKHQEEDDPYQNIKPKIVPRTEIGVISEIPSAPF